MTLFDIFLSNAAPMGIRTAWFGKLNLLEQVTMTNKTTQAPLALRPREAAKSLGISPRSLWQLTHDGHIPCKRIGNGKRQIVLYPMADLQAWLSGRTEVTKGADDAQ